MIYLVYGFLVIGVAGVLMNAMALYKLGVTWRSGLYLYRECLRRYDERQLVGDRSFFDRADDLELGGINHFEGMDQVIELERDLFANKKALAHYELNHGKKNSEEHRLLIDEVARKQTDIRLMYFSVLFEGMVRRSAIFITLTVGSLLILVIV